jgi:ActR/RegA family two-component response regulator
MAPKPDLLIVDDDPLIADTLSFVLGRDFNVCVADTRARAQRAAPVRSGARAGAG